LALRATSSRTGSIPWPWNATKRLKAANNPEQDYTLKIGASGREMGVGAE